MRSINVLGALPYEEVRGDCHAVKTAKSSQAPVMIRCAKRIVASLVDRRCFLVPAPSHGGTATDTLQLALAIAEEINRAEDGFAAICDILTCDPHISLCELKHQGGDPSRVKIKVRLTDTPAAKLLRRGPRLPIYIVDNVVDTGHTAEACLKALPTSKGILAIGDTGTWKERT